MDNPLKCHMSIIVNLRCLLPMIGLLFLQACQHNDEVPNGATAKKSNLSDAASYNTQLGLAYLQQGDRPRAKRKLFLALRQAPDVPSVNAALAYFMEKSGEMEEARTYYKKAMALAPGSGAQLNNYGAFLCRQGQYVQADQYFLKAVKDHGYEHTAGAYENAGLCAMAIPDLSKAKEYFEKALEQDPSRVQSLYELVNLDVKQDQMNEALSYLQKYSSLSLRDPTLLALAVDVAHKTGKIELEADYKARLNSISDKTGGRDEYNSNSG